MSDARTPVRLGLLGTVFVVVLAALAFAGRRGLWEPDEGRYTAVALQMLETGDWIHPRLDHGHPHFSKPPLTYWCIATSVALFGRSEWAVRLPGALAFAATALGTGLLARRLTPGRGSIAAALYATSALPFIASNVVTTDTILTLWETLGMLGLVCAWPRFARADPAAGGEAFGPWPRRRVVPMWLAFGLGFATKGPPALLPLLAGVLAVARLDGRRSSLRPFQPLGLLCFLAVGGGWYLLVVSQQPDLLRYFLHDEVYARVATGSHGRNPEWYKALMFPALLIAGMLPWSGAWFGKGRRKWIAHPLESAAGDPALILLGFWVLVPLAVFMLARSRLPLYVLPLMPPLAILTARLRPGHWLASRRAWMWILTTLAVLLSIRFGSAAVGGRDAGRLASQLSLPSEAREIVYVDTSPWRGLYFYTGREVEQVRLERVEGEPGHSLAEKLAEREGVLLLAARPEDADRVAAVVTRQGWSIAGRQSLAGRWFAVVAPPRWHAPAGGGGGAQG